MYVRESECVECVCDGTLLMRMGVDGVAKKRIKGEKAEQGPQAGGMENKEEI
jgi:hypothetical protein